MTRFPLIALIAAALLGVLIALFVVFPRAPVPEQQGTAPSVVTNSTGAEAQSLGTGADPREREASGNTSRAARGSGIEGVTSGGTTHDSPGAR